MKPKHLLLIIGCSILGGFAAMLISLNVGAPRLTGADCRDAACADPPCCNGDCNGDTFVNIADAICLLTYLFAGGPEPQPILTTPGQCDPMPGTGQTRCWDEEGNEIDCESETCPGQDGLQGTGCPMAGRFLDNGDGTVTDTCTGLIWQKETEGPTMTWCDALEYCGNLDLAGRSDWRLPNIRELQSLVDYGRNDPAIDPLFGAESSWYWSSTSYVSDGTHAWVVALLNGHVSDVQKGFRTYVRAVAGGQ